MRTLIPVVCLATAFLATPPNAGARPGTRMTEHTDTLHGRTVADPYRWLEADVRESAEVAEWVKRQQSFTEAYLEKLPEREAFRQRLTKLWDYERYSTPEKAGKRYMYLKNDGLQDQALLYLTDNLEDDGRVLLDPNEWSDDGTVSLSGYSASHDGRYLAYKKSVAGSDWTTIHVLDLDTGEHLSDELKWVRFSGVEWLKSGEGFFYNRYPKPAEGQKYQSVALGPKVCYHKVGQPQADDKVIYERPDHPDWSLDVEETHDGAYLFATMQRGTDWQNQLLYRKAESPDAEFTPLVENFDNVFSVIGNQGKRVYLLTDYQAPRRRVVVMDLDQPNLEHLEEIIPESEGSLQGVSLIDGKLIATYLQDVAAEVRVYDLAGKLERNVPLPGLGSVSGFGGEPDDTETFFVYHSYNAAPSIYRYDVPSGQTTLLREPKIDFNSADYEVEREFYKSKDGARIPIFLVYKKGMERNGKNPTLLYGYGGFSISITPGFSISRLAWLEHGGVLAVANLRGGGEYGEAWHQAGKVEKKQNVFDDFIAAAEWLCDQKITSPQHLGIQGRSNGGLLVGAVMTQRPDLFGACLPAVGVMDMLRFHLFTAGQFWRTEYGSAEDPAQFETLLAYSPYHNIKPGTHYPPTLVSTADTDDRVVPMHSFKFGARLQAAQGGAAPILLDIETSAGHGAGTPTSKLIEQAADDWAFLWEHLADEE